VRQIAQREPRFVVVQALPKGDRAELAVELLTELGVDEIVPWAAARSIRRWRSEQLDKGLAKWRRTAVEASKQSRRSRVPLVSSLAATTEVAGRITSTTLSVVLHEQASDALAVVSVPDKGTVLIVVGPEGGITEDELTQFTAAGARLARLGPEIVRTSTAGAAALAVLSASAGRWA
jgi:16S rRNA (uracil1498-N3)-methyltransferase